MGRTVEGRSELAELADDSASSAHATITSSPRRARSMTERQLFLYASSGEAVEQLEHECKTLVSVAYKTIDSLGPPLSPTTSLA